MTRRSVPSDCRCSLSFLLGADCFRPMKRTTIQDIPAAVVRPSTPIVVVDGARAALRHGFPAAGLGQGVIPLGRRLIQSFHYLAGSDRNFLSTVTLSETVAELVTSRLRLHSQAGKRTQRCHWYQGLQPPSPAFNF